MANYRDILYALSESSTALPQVMAGVDVWVLASDGSFAPVTDDNGAAIIQPLISSPLGIIEFNVPDPGDFYTLEYRYGGRLMRTDTVMIGIPPAYGPYAFTQAVTITPSVLVGYTDQTPSIEALHAWGQRFLQQVSFQIAFSARDVTNPTGALVINNLPFTGAGPNPWPLSLVASGLPAGTAASLVGDTIQFIADGVGVAPLGGPWNVSVSGSVPVLP